MYSLGDIITKEVDASIAENIHPDKQIEVFSCGGISYHYHQAHIYPRITTKESSLVALELNPFPQYARHPAFRNLYCSNYPELAISDT